MEANVVLRQEHVRDRGPNLGLIASQPQQLRGREPGQRFVAGDRDQALTTDDLADRIALSIENRRLYAEARDLFEQSVSANFVSTPDGALLACNQTFAALLGFSSVQEVLAAPASSFYADPPIRDELLAQLRAHRRIAGRELLLRRQDGRIVTVRADALGRPQLLADLTAAMSHLTRLDYFHAGLIVDLIAVTACVPFGLVLAHRRIKTGS